MSIKWYTKDTLVVEDSDDKLEFGIKEVEGRNIIVLTGVTVPLVPVDSEEGVAEPTRVRPGSILVDDPNKPVRKVDSRGEIHPLVDMPSWADEEEPLHKGVGRDGLYELETPVIDKVREVISQHTQHKEPFTTRSIWEELRQSGEDIKFPTIRRAISGEWNRPKSLLRKTFYRSVVTGKDFSMAYKYTPRDTQKQNNSSRVLPSYGKAGTKWTLLQLHALTKYEQEGLSDAEIAKKLGRSEGAIRRKRWEREALLSDKRTTRPHNLPKLVDEIIADYDDRGAWLNGRVLQRELIKRAGGGSFPKNYSWGALYTRWHNPSSRLRKNFAISRSSGLLTYTPKWVDYNDKAGGR